MYTTTIVYLPHVNQLFPPCSRNLVGQFLVAKRFPRSFDDVHLVSRAGSAGGEVLEAGGTSHFEDEMLDAETEAYKSLYRFRVSNCRGNLPGGLE